MWKYEIGEAETGKSLNERSGYATRSEARKAAVSELNSRYADEVSDLEVWMDEEDPGGGLERERGTGGAEKRKREASWEKEVGDG